MASRQQRKEQARAERLAAEEAGRRAQQRRRSLGILGAVLAAAAVIVAVAVIASSGGGDSRAASGGGADAKEVASLFRGIPQDGVHLGKVNAPTLIEFADLQCPYCGEYARDALSTVVRRYVRTGKLRYELRVRNIIPGNDSLRAAGAAAVAARQNRLYQFSELFYQRQKTENSGYVTDDFLRNIARDTGVDPSRAVMAATHAGSQPLVKQAQQLASQIGSDSTPDFYLRLSSGRLVPVRPQALTADGMVQAIDQVLPASARSGT